MIPQYATFVVCSLLLLLPIHFPYYQAKQQWGFSRSLDECLFYSADLGLSYVTIPSLMNDLYLPLFRLASNLRSYERTLFPGFVLPVLLLLGIFPRRGLPLPAGLRQMKPIYWLLLITAFLLSLGPSLMILGRNLHIPLPYLGLYYLAPGFQAMRVPARFGLMVMLAAGVLAALGFLKVCSRLHASCPQLSLPVCHAVLAICWLSLFMLELGFKPLALARIQTGDEIPAVYRWLAAEKPGPMIEVPLGRGEDYQYMYFSTYHWLPLVNGWSGFIPPTYGQTVQAFQALPSRQAVESLSAMGVKAMVVHLGRLQRHVALQWRQAQLAELGLEQVAAFGTDIVYRILPVDSTHVLHGELAVPDQLPTGARMRLGLSVQGKDHRLWASPRPPGRVSAVVQWVELRTGKTIIDRGALELPSVIEAGQALFVGLPVRIPVVPGRYLLEVYVPSLALQTPPQRVELTRAPLPTSLNAPQLLAAAYTAEGIPTPVITTEPVAMTVKAINTGKAIWLAQAEGARGAVRLGWRWLKGDQEIPTQGGRELLTYDVFPGQEFAFHTKIPPPMEPGEYRLEVGLLSELVTWFADQGVKPFRAAIHVVNPSGDFEHVLAEQLKAVGDPPRLAIATDQPRYRPGDRLRVRGDVVNAGSARTIDAYVALAWPDKRVSFGIGNGVLGDLRGSWVPLAKGMGLAEGGRLVALPLLDLPLVNMPSGPYTCYLLLTELNTFDIIAKAQVLFRLEP
jgi:hypothetical protein